MAKLDFLSLIGLLNYLRKKENKLTVKMNPEHKETDN